MKQDPEKKKSSIPKERAVYVLTEEDIKRNQERESTKRLKELFLNILERNRGLITNVCEKTGIARGTYYNWLKTDKKFKEKVDEIMRAKPEVLEDILYVAAAKGDVGAAKFILSHTHPDYKKKAKNDKDSVVHIYHHVDKLVKKEEKSFTALLYEEAHKKRLKVESLKKEFEGKEFPLKPDGTPIVDTEMFYYERFIRDWFKQKNLERELVEEES